LLLLCGEFWLERLHQGAVVVEVVAGAGAGAGADSAAADAGADMAGRLAQASQRLRLRGLGPADRLRLAQPGRGGCATG